MVWVVPLLVRFVLAPHHGTYAAVGAKEIEAVASLHGYSFTIGLALLGAVIGTRLRIPAGALLVLDLGVLRQVARAAPAAIAAILGIITACGALAGLLAGTTHLSLLDAYLATTPGGINAVLVTAFASGANTSLVIGVQGVRLFIMVLAAPVLVRFLVRRHARLTRPGT